MKTSDFDYYLPEELIAQKPAHPRDSSRLLVAESDGTLSHKHFYDVAGYFMKGDVLVINSTRVLPARLIGKTKNGGAMEFLLLKRLDAARWEVLVKPGKKAKPGAEISFGDGLMTAIIESVADGGGRVARFICDGVFEERLNELGQMPLPPYITEKLDDKERYQTVYAKEEGSAAAPTAGLHFTPELLQKIRGMGVKIVPILLHVGLGTFRPVKTEEISQHHMHSEYYEVTEDAARIINESKASGGRVVCTGTTSVRVLESCASGGKVVAGSGWTDIFISPGFQFQLTDMLITNFHLPKSTLLMLVSAFYGREEILAAYETAIRERYRVFSFGDAMLLYRRDLHNNS